MTLALSQEPPTRGCEYAGKIVEIGTAEEVYYDPRHPYTWAASAGASGLATGG